MVRVRIALAAAAAALLVGGCGATSAPPKTFTDGPSPVATAQPAPTPEPTKEFTPEPEPEPSPKPLSVQQKAKVFLTLVRANLDDFGVYDDAQVLKLGFLVCQSFKDGNSTTDIGGVMVDNGISVHDAGYFIGYSVGAFCPDQKGAMDA